MGYAGICLRYIFTVEQTHMQLNIFSCCFSPLSLKWLLYLIRHLIMRSVLHKVNVHAYYCRKETGAVRRSSASHNLSPFLGQIHQHGYTQICTSDVDPLSWLGLSPGQRVKCPLTSTSSPDFKILPQDTAQAVLAPLNWCTGISVGFGGPTCKSSGFSVTA